MLIFRLAQQLFNLRARPLQEAADYPPNACLKRVLRNGLSNTVIQRSTDREAVHKVGRQGRRNVETRMHTDPEYVEGFSEPRMNLGWVQQMRFPSQFA
jgi:hypothetical protein